MMKKLFLFFQIITLTVISAFSQQVTTSLNIDKKNLVIGDQAKLTVSVNSPPDYLVNFPIFGDSLSSGVEIVNLAPIDTFLTNDEKTRTLNQIYTITIFDSGLYYIRPFSIQFKKPGSPAFDSILTDSLLVTVKTIPVDTTKAIKDIKAPIRAPLTMVEIFEYLGILLAGAAIVLIILYFIYKVRRKEPLIPFPEKPKPAAHITAIEDLEKLRQKKLWQSGFVKEYHSDLTDILRLYIERRFLFNAMEMVTSEILDSFRRGDISPEMMKKLGGLLYLADMVKFAKYKPMPDENDASLNDAVSFVRSTIPAESAETIKENSETKLM